MDGANFGGQGGLLMRHIGIECQQIAGPGETPAVVTLPGRDKVQVFLFGGRSRLEAAALAFVQGAISGDYDGAPVTNERISQAFDFAEAFIAESDRRNAQRQSKGEQHD